jgi:hypothetical protein
MIRPVWVTALGSEFDDFLFAPIAEESNGMMLSVISALARLDLDPWQEANNLAGLPGETATKRLASLLMAALPDGPSARRDPETIAARLTALLPRRAGPNIARRITLFGADDVKKLRAGISMYVVFMVFMLVAQLIMAIRQPSAQIDGVPAQAAVKVSPQLPLPNSRQ